MKLVIIMLSMSLLARAETLAFKDNLITLSLQKNHNPVQGKIKASGSADINNKSSDIINLKIKLDAKTLQFKDKNDSLFFKSDNFFAASKFEYMMFTSSKLKLSSSEGGKQTYTGDMEVKIKNKTDVVKIQAEFVRNKNQCSFDFPLEIKDRTAKLGLKFNSKKYTSEVELGENLIDDKLSFSFSLKCN